MRTFKTKPTSSCPDLFRASMFSACLRQGLADAGVMAKRTMRAFDEMCLTPADDVPPEKSGRSACGRTPVKRYSPAI